MKYIGLSFVLTIMITITSCGVKQNNDAHQQQMQKELTVIDSLLRSEDYAFEMAKTLDSSYYVGVGETPLPFLAPGEDTASFTKLVKDEKVATSIAGFYALECSIGILYAQTNEPPFEWIKRIAERSVDSNTVFLINRFANATWKAGQPFRGLERIKRTPFTVYSFLPDSEVVKDYDQVAAAAVKLLPSMQGVKDSSADIQFNKIKQLMQDTAYAVIITIGQDAGNDTATIKKSVKEQKIATNVAGFYALECGLNYFAAKNNILPSHMLDSIINNTISEDDKLMFARFANATWKASQPFRALSRIRKDNFIPARYLSDEELEKDFVQIQTSAKKLRESL